MKRRTLWIFCFLSVALAVTPQGQAPSSSSLDLAKLMPAGPLLYLESPDFAALLGDWNKSAEKKAWLESDDYRVFSRSRLYLRLKEAQEEFAVAAGAPPDMPLLESIAGSQSALALYDIGNLEFLYVTRLPAARAMDSVLARGKEKLEPRKVAETSYYVHTEPAKHRMVAFAATNDYLLLATREDLLVGALSTLAGKAMRTLAEEPWFTNARAAAARPGDLRLALNLASLVKAPHFRSYWIQRNIPALRQYNAEIADIYRSREEIREERVLLRTTTGSATEPATPDESAVAGLLRLVPDDSGLYRAWTAPSTEQALDLLRQKVLSPAVGPGVPSTYAPSVMLSEGQTGSEQDLETRIDVPPFTTAGGTFEPEALKKLLGETKLVGALQLESAREMPGGVFVGTQSAIVLEAAADWNAEAARAALLSSVAGLWTTSELGAQWVERGTGETAHGELDGLTPLAMAVRGKLLIVGSGGNTVVAVLEHVSSAPGKDGGVYAAGFRHTTERSALIKMTRLIEGPLVQQLGGNPGPGGHEPWFFSENLGSLSHALARVQSESVVVHDRGPVVSQTVVYRLSR
ncbi:MAG TPA: hypothetical protein VG204_20710 [Terriglobia bacterium]|nr:hypothetical protein [Terriglobia bacterium]